MSDTMQQPSWWHRSGPEPVAYKPTLSQNLDVDVAIVGAGYTGLWAAYYLKKAKPSLNICILERETVGFGASGRNGGWCLGLMAASNEEYEAVQKGGALRMHRAIQDAVDEVGRVSQSERIDCDYAKGGVMYTARNDFEMGGLEYRAEDAWSTGLTKDDVKILSAEEVRERLNIPNVIGGMYSPDAAAIHPYKLVHGLAQVVSDLGVEIYEHTEVSEIGQRVLKTKGATVKADVIIKATEAYSNTIKGYERQMAPIYSHMIVTEPFSKSQWEEIGLNNRELIEDGRYLVYYAQRTADDRLAIGGRAFYYRMGSNTGDAFTRNHATHTKLERLVEELFPMVGKVKAVDK